MHLLLTLCLISWWLEEGHCQAYPYLSFQGNTLVNNSYLNYSHLGATIGDSVQCITNLGMCCSSSQGSYRGNWFSPDGTQLQFNNPDSTEPAYQTRTPQQVNLFRRSNVIPSGIYCCVIPTHISDSNILCIGLYRSEGICR